MKKLNLGCGKDIKRGYVNLDKIKSNGVDVVHGLDKFPYPFEDDTFDEILMNEILEHIKDLEENLYELYRISKNGCIWKIKVPHFSSSAAIDIHHRNYFKWNTFLGNKEGKKSLEKDFFDNLKIIKRRFIFPKIYGWLINKFTHKFPIVYEFSILKNLFPDIYNKS